MIQTHCRVKSGLLLQPGVEHTDNFVIGQNVIFICNKNNGRLLVQLT